MAGFGSDRVLLYDVRPWNELGFGCPNFGDNQGSLNQPIWGLVDEIGQGQLYIMTHIDAQRKQPPSINTVMRLGKIVNRVQSVLVIRQKQYSDLRLEEGHSTASPEPFLIHPVPFFDGALARNRWLKEYNRLCMIALTNLMQHSDNNIALTITADCAARCWQYFREIKYLLGAELLGIDLALLKDDTFRFDQKHYDAYKPDEVVLNIEPLDRPGPIFSRLTEDDLRPLLDGIPANLIAPNLKQYPIGPIPGAEGYSGSPLPAADSIMATSGGATAPAGGTIGDPQV